MQTIKDQTKRGAVAEIDPDVEEELNEPRRVPYRANEDNDDDPVHPPDEDERQIEKSRRQTKRKLG